MLEREEGISNSNTEQLKNEESGENYYLGYS